MQLLGVSSCSLLLPLLLLIAPVLSAPSDGLNLRKKSTHSPLSTSATLRGLGTVRPFALSNAVRYTLPYAQAPIGDLRFANPQRLRALPANYDAAVQASGCMQGDGSYAGAGMYSEDCLFMDVYIPSGTTSSSDLPVLVWLPGGSFISGSARDLDGSVLAAEQNMIVIVLQYRLGAFGWLQSASILDERRGGSPGGSRLAGNQAVRDVVTALRFVQDHATSLGGDADKVTLSGHSSGAHMVRALLGTSAADSLFSQAILASDPQNYGAANVATQNELGQYALDQLSCSTVACARQATAQAVLDASAAAFSDVPASNGAIPLAEPWRPTMGSYIAGDVQRNADVGPERRIIVTTVSNEAGTAVGRNFGATEAGATQLPLLAIPGVSLPLAQAAEIPFNNGRGERLASRPAYAQNASIVGVYDGLRTLYEGLATDGLWRCASQRTALALAQAGNTVYLAEHYQGYPHPSNIGNDYCESNGKVCHEDDIYLIFGTPHTAVTSAAEAASRELRARWGSFVRGRNPNGSGYPNWRSTRSTTNLNLLQLGVNTDGSSAITSQQRLQACSVWGSSVKYDWQLYA